MRVRSLLHKAELYVSRLLTAQLPKGLYYHNLAHTVSVVRVAHHLATASRLTPEAREQLLLAAWFHDTGFIECYEGHEAVSQRLLEDFLAAQGCPADRVDPRLIGVTHKAARPYDLSSELLKDADLNNLGTAHYEAATRALRRELAAQQNLHYSDADWQDHCVAFVREHRFYSVTGRALLAEGKRLNLARLTSRNA